MFSTREVIGIPQKVFANFGDTLGIYCDVDAIMRGDCEDPYCEKPPAVTNCPPTPTPTPNP
jgi:hypothetical protein